MKLSYLLIRREKIPGTDLVGTVMSRHSTPILAGQQDRNAQPSGGGYVPTAILKALHAHDVGDLINERDKGKTWRNVDEEEHSEFSRAANGQG